MSAWSTSVRPSLTHGPASLTVGPARVPHGPQEGAWREREDKGGTLREHGFPPLERSIQIRGHPLKNPPVPFSCTTTKLSELRCVMSFCMLTQCDQVIRVEPVLGQNFAPCWRAEPCVF